MCLSQKFGFKTGALLCMLAAVSANFLSGVGFPEQNNIWHVPVVLDYAATPEGPHDVYNASFKHFVSAFWLIPRIIATDANLEIIFVTLQIIGNAALGFSVYMLIQFATQRRFILSSLVASFFCFCYGLWGFTRLGYSELFVGYATHTQFAIILCLLSFTLLLRGHSLWSAVLLSLAADTNLFMAAWGGLSAGLFLIVNERRLLSRDQISFAALFITLTAPVLVWALYSSGGSGEIPLEFFRTFLKGHVYAFDYPQAAVQTLALGLAASLTALVSDREDQRLRHLGLLTLICVTVLGVGAVMPYITSVQLLLLLHPLRYVSITVLLSACCAGALLVKAIAGGSRLDPIPTFIATAGFLLKSPVISIFGFALVLRETVGWSRYIGVILAVAGPLGQLLYSPITETSAKSGWGFLLLCIVVSIAAWGRSTKVTSPDLTTKLVSASVLGGLVTASPFEQMSIAALLSTVAVIACLWPMTTGRRLIALSANAGAAVIIFLSVQNDPERLTLLMVGVGIMTIAAYVPRLHNDETSGIIRAVALSGIVATLVGGGFAKGAASGFWVVPSSEQRDLAAAGAWARANTLPDTMFLPISETENFTIFSRRPVWWASSQGAAVLWLPGFYNHYVCREHAVAEANTPDKIATLAVLANIEYILARNNAVQNISSPVFHNVFENGHYIILKNTGGSAHDPLCQDVGERPSK